MRGYYTLYAIRGNFFPHVTHVTDKYADTSYINILYNNKFLAILGTQNAAHHDVWLRGTLPKYLPISKIRVLYKI